MVYIDIIHTHWNRHRVPVRPHSGKTISIGTRGGVWALQQKHKWRSAQSQKER